MVLGELCLNLTIVIPTRNRTKQVRWLVHKLKPLNSELIVVDDYSQRPVMVDGATVVRNPRRLGSGESRNVGCRLAKSNWLLLIDDDLAPSAGLVRFIDRLLPTLKCKDIIGFRIVGSNKVGSRSITYRFTGLFRVLNILFGVDISPRTGRLGFSRAPCYSRPVFSSRSEDSIRKYTAETDLGKNLTYNIGPAKPEANSPISRTRSSSISTFRGVIRKDSPRTGSTT